jgi:hypothetical protein
MSDEITPLPAIPESLRIAAREGTLVPFIGAGVSRLGGCPDWDGFANGTLRFFVDKGLLSHAQFDQLSHLGPRIKLSIAQRLEEQYRVDIDFKALLDPRPASAKRDGEQIYAQLAKLASVFVTTNYDEWLDQQQAPQVAPLTAGQSPTQPLPSKTILFRPEEFTARSLETPNTIIHIHGSVRERTSMVFTTTHYLDRYAGHRIVGQSFRENAYLTFLEVLFRTKNVVFIGYGLAELEILEYVIQKAREAKPASPATGLREEPRHFLLQGFYSHQAELRRSLTDYYLRECNIRLIPFSMDVRGHLQLLEVLEFLSREIPVGQVHALRQRLEMEELLT